MCDRLEFECRARIRADHEQHWDYWHYWDCWNHGNYGNEFHDGNHYREPIAVDDTGCQLFASVADRLVGLAGPVSLITLISLITLTALTALIAPRWRIIGRRRVVWCDIAAQSVRPRQSGWDEQSGQSPWPDTPARFEHVDEPDYLERVDRERTTAVEFADAAAVSVALTPDPLGYTHARNHTEVRQFLF